MFHFLDVILVSMLSLLALLPALIVWSEIDDYLFQKRLDRDKKGL